MTGIFLWFYEKMSSYEATEVEEQGYKLMEVEEEAEELMDYEEQQHKAVEG